jgi:alpha-D-ribose 1-methylphosphonate 5-triphosphate synthase subunit PhnL
VALLARAVPRVAQLELVVQEPVVQEQAEQQQAEQQQAERPLQGLPRQRPAV